MTVTILTTSTQMLANDMAALKKEAVGIVKSFAGELKGTLKGALKEGGPIAGLETCNLNAEGITKAVSDAAIGWDVSRTALKLRNPNNRADAWEEKVLNKFEERKAAGEDVKKMAFAEIVVEDGVKTFRFMKAIPTAKKPCTACHGANIKENVAKLLNEKYPQDQAVGFKEGDIRGAFTLKKALN